VKNMVESFGGDLQRQNGLLLCALRANLFLAALILLLS